MNKKNIFLIIIVLFTPIIVNASKIDLICDEIILSNSFSCTLVGYSDKNISSLSATVSQDNDVSFLSFSKNSLWQGDGEDGKIDLYTDKDITGNFDIGTLKFNIVDLNKDSVIINIINISFYDLVGREEVINNFTKTISIKSNNDNSENITPSVPNNSNDNSPYVEYNNENSYNENNYSDNNNSNKETSSNNANLEKLVLSVGNIDFNKDVTTYYIEISNDIEKIDVEAVPESKDSKVEIIGNDNLSLGYNQIKILVTSSRGNTKEYIINVTKSDSVLSSNNYISNIDIKGYDIKFDKEKLYYNLKIKDDNSLKINVELEDSKSKYKIRGNVDLKNNSIIKIEVEAEDKSIRTYTIKVKKSYTVNKIIIFVSLTVILVYANIIRIILKKRKQTFN